uniref:Uncharacterized protein n=1 Tax=Plectus sambesii TaxID=2011161 RepID=A0A914UPZ9_9BILA
MSTRKRALTSSATVIHSGGLSYQPIRVEGMVLAGAERPTHSCEDDTVGLLGMLHLLSQQLVAEKPDTFVPAVVSHDVSFSSLFPSKSTLQSECR